MYKNYKNIQWVVQRNLTNRADFEGLKYACLKMNIKFIEIDIVPFSSALPKYDSNLQSIFYGSTTFNCLVFEDVNLRKGLFFDDITFTMKNYIKKWGRYMLNNNAFVITFKEFIEGFHYNADKLLFIRPNEDDKSFSGEVRRFGEIIDFYQQIKTGLIINLSPDSKIVVSEPFNLQYEWRLWIVNKKVVAASKYREYFNVKKEEGCPIDVIDFAEERCKQYTPHNVFVMDICLCGDEYFIVECGCMNGAGFYKANIENIVSSVTNYFISSI